MLLSNLHGSPSSNITRVIMFQITHHKMLWQPGQAGMTLYGTLARTISSKALQYLKRGKEDVDVAVMYGPTVICAAAISYTVPETLFNSWRA